MKAFLRQGGASLRMLLVFTLLFGVLYPLAVTGIGQLPGLRARADGSLVRADGRVVGSALLAQPFTDAKGRPLPQYFQPRPSIGGYDPRASGASNLGPESVEDRPGVPSLLSEVCARSLAVGRFDGVDGRRPYCTATGVGAVLRVFYARPGYRGAVTAVVSVNEPCPAVPFVARYFGVPVHCAHPHTDYRGGRLVIVRGSAPSHPAVPADAVTASASGLDPDISPAYARIQERCVAAARQVPLSVVAAIVRAHTAGRTLGFLGAPTVDVLAVNVALDERYPMR